VAVHPAYDEGFDGFADPSVRGNPKARQAWAVDQVMLALQASQNMGIGAHATFSGALAWPYLYPWPQRPAGLVEAAFDELAKRWKPILDKADECGVDVCYEIHPGEDLHDGVTFEMFLERLNGHTRCNMLYDPSHYVLQHLDYLANIDIYHERIRMFHVKDAELNPTGRQGVYSGYQSWVDRAGRFRSLGDGQVDFKGIFSKLAAYDFDGWAVVDDHYELVAGAFSSTAEKSALSASDLGVDADRAYASFSDMAEAESAREDGIEAVSIVTPNHLHYSVAKAFLEKGIHVICDKPLTSSLSDAEALVKTVEDSKALYPDLC